MNRLIACFALLLALWLPLPAAAQSCTVDLTPTMNFGTLVGLPTPASAITVTATVRCTNFLSSTKVCLGANAGTGTGSTVAGRRLSITTPQADFVTWGLFMDAAHSLPLSDTGSQRIGLNFPFTFLETRTQTATLYGLLTPGQTGKSVGNYLSTITVTATAVNNQNPDCASVNNPEDTATFDASVLINPACTIGSTPLVFGTYTTGTTHNAASNLSVNCTRNGPYSITLDGGSVNNNVSARRMRLGPGPSTINYQLYRNSTRTQVWGNTVATQYSGTGNGNTQSIPVYGQVLSQGIKPAGTYTDTITATITF